ncbi:MAG: hypothetical protein GX242_02025 [Clostridiales bacterium]|nr:hypothetical protein [Clostridiales bacterium]
MEFFVQFGLLFSNMEWFVVVCLIVGLVALFVEIFEPGFGVFGILGLILLALAVILRAIFHKDEDNVLLQIFQLILFIFILAGGAFTLFLVGNKKQWWKRTSLYQLGTAVDAEHSQGTENFKGLIGKQGSTLTDLRPIGKMLLEGKTYDVFADKLFIEKDTKVEVIAVEGVKIIVKSTD